MSPGSTPPWVPSPAPRQGAGTRLLLEDGEIYAGTLRVDVLEVVANDDHGVVLTRESGVVAGEHIAWTGVHVWSFAGDRVQRFVNYGSAEYQRHWARLDVG